MSFTLSPLQNSWFVSTDLVLSTELVKYGFFGLYSMTAVAALRSQSQENRIRSIEMREAFYAQAAPYRIEQLYDGFCLNE